MAKKGLFEYFEKLGEQITFQLNRLRMTFTRFFGDGEESEYFRELQAENANIQAARILKDGFSEEEQAKLDRQKNAEDTKSGAGQYFTPRSLIKIIVRCMKPLPMQTISDPACGTGGFFLGAYDYLLNNYKLDKNQKAFLKQKTFSGNEIVPNTRRMCLMNMLLHNIGEIDGESLINSNDALISSPLKTVDMVLANPPFGKKSSLTFTNEEGEQEKDDLTYNRQDFWATTSNKQVNFVQHIRTMLKSNGKAAVIVPDNVLFEGGAGETVRKRLLETTNLHTILRLPTGIFYAKGVKANVIFFDNKTAQKENWTKEI